MNAPVTGPRDSSAGFSVKIAFTMAAVIITGILATAKVSPWFAASTLIVMAMLALEARRAMSSDSVPPEYAEFSPALRATVDRALAQLPDGDARRLLTNALVQARPLLAPHAAALDERQESATRENVSALVEACCTTALELQRLDTASSAGGAGNIDASRLAAAREVRVGRLTQAATALSSLYIAGVAHGSPASDAVAHLADEINADARARSAAASEINALLGDGGQSSSEQPAKG